ncbi:MAG TPA: hypothetical protein VIJ38_04035 [Acidobacteriaceae bacterium]
MNVIGCAEWSLKTSLLNKVTVHGFVAGRFTCGSAVAGLDEPTTGVGETVTTWAAAIPWTQVTHAVAMSNAGAQRADGPGLTFF